MPAGLAVELYHTATCITRPNLSSITLVRLPPPPSPPAYCSVCLSRSAWLCSGR